MRKKECIKTNKKKDQIAFSFHFANTVKYKNIYKYTYRIISANICLDMNLNSWI